MRTATRSVWSAVVVLVAVLPVVVGSAASAATQRKVPTAREAWYEVSPLASGEEPCLLPTGCATTPLQPFPEDTLHVGVSAGRDNARTFITLDTARLPLGARIVGGTLHLPVAGADAGTLRPDAADLVACSFTAPFKEVSGGSPDEQPAFDCKTKSPAKLDDKANPPTFAVDLAPLATTLSRRGTGIALVPSPAAHEASETWRVVFSGKERDAEDAKPITADLRYEAAADHAAGSERPDESPPDAQAQPPPNAQAQPPPNAQTQPPADTVEPPGAAFSADAADPAPISGELAAGSGPIAPVGGVAPAPADGRDAPVAAGPEAAAAPAPVASAPVAAAAPWPYMYPGMWFTPLVLAAIAAALAQSLTTEMPIPGAADSRRRDVLGRVIAALEALRTPPMDQPTSRPV